MMIGQFIYFDLPDLAGDYYAWASSSSELGLRWDQIIMRVCCFLVPSNSKAAAAVAQMNKHFFMGTK